jgi:hypothetical protein
MICSPFLLKKDMNKLENEKNNILSGNVGEAIDSSGQLVLDTNVKVQLNKT